MIGTGSTERSEAAVGGSSMGTQSAGAVIKAHVVNAKRNVQAAEQELRRAVPLAQNLIVSKTFEKTLRQIERLMSDLGELNLP